MRRLAKAKGRHLRCGFETICKLNLLDDPDVQNACQVGDHVLYGGLVFSALEELCGRRQHR